ncbi:MAG TPA: hypothetical protein VNP73_01890, partial [Actinomycetota bacterium]|nr:hypothetical protein [Actinomycetota bacterium]
VLVRIDADTNADRRPDVWVTYANGNPALQYEDTDFDGAPDQAFDLATEEPIALEGQGGNLPVDPFEQISCGGFSEYWKTWRN